MNDKFIANYKIKCDVCDSRPTVDIKRGGEKISHSDLCGVCFFGESEMLDTDKWETQLEHKK